MSIKRWKLGWKRCDCVKCEAALTIEQTEEDCGWVRWGDHKEENARLKAEVERLTEAGNNLWAFAHNCVILGMLPKTAQEKIDIWNAAKEGKPSV